MKHTVFITTGKNSVHDLISKIENIEIIDCCQFHSKSSFLLHLSKIGQIDFLICFRCPYIIPLQILSQVRISAINIHPSLLPKYAGANPWGEMVLRQETEGGITIHQLTDTADCGSILAQKRFSMNLANGITEARKKSEEMATEMLRKYLLFHSNILRLEAETH